MKFTTSTRAQCLLLAAVCGLIFSNTLNAEIPRTISYQGVLADANGNPKPDGDYAFTFRLYETSNGGNAIWSEAKTLAVKRGLFSTALGDQTAFGVNVKFDKPYWLGIQVGNEPELPDRIALSSSAYSLNSLKADVAATVAEGQVVKSINALKDDVTLEGAGGATVTAAGGKITISAVGGGGTGIQGVQNTDNTLDIANPNGPTATVNLKSPLVPSLAGNFRIVDESANATRLVIGPDGNVGIGELGNPQAKLDVQGTTRTGVLQITGGSDMAEPFEISDEQALEPGTVMIIDADHPGKLLMSQGAYDSKVAGIVSGAAGVKAGLTLHQEGVLDGNALVAIAGRVYCKAEAISAPIQPGDLLTTSSIAGHAMKAINKERSHGAIIGKAMSALKDGRGLVLVLVNLQ